MTLLLTFTVKNLVLNMRLLVGGRTMKRVKYYGRDYFLQQARLLSWYVQHGHSELEFVNKFAVFPYSTIDPLYITATLLHIFEMIPRS